MCVFHAREMAPARRLKTDSIFDKQKLLAFLEDGLGRDKRPGTAARHCRAILAAAVKDAESGREALDLSEARLPNIPKWAREGIPARFDLMTTSIADCRTSRDGSTTKMVVELQDGHRVESVVMRHDKGGRVTLCVSSQVGCKMGCTFCATGTLGELGNLTAGEILEQLVHAQRLFAPGGELDDIPPPGAGTGAGAASRGGGGGASERTGRGGTPPTPTHVSGTRKGVGVRNVVFMGMGEPLNNYDAVIAALGPMTDPQCFAVAPSRCTVSTVGVVPKMRSIVTDAPGVNLALSLHAPNQTLREKIVPTATAYKLHALMDALDFYLATGHRMRTMVEYCVLGGVNDSEECAKELGELLRGRDIILNLIPYNPTDVPMGHSPPTPSAVKAMVRVLTGLGLFTTVRHEMGQDIAGACGQLALKKGSGQAEVAGSSPGSSGDIEDLAGPSRVKATAGSPRRGVGSGPALRSRAKSRKPDNVALLGSSASDGAGNAECGTSTDATTTIATASRHRPGWCGAEAMLAGVAMLSLVMLIAALAWKTSETGAT